MTRFLSLGILAATAWAGDWNPQQAATYLDQRQKEWSVWQPAAAPGGACLSCHTGLGYLLARPALSKALASAQPAEQETALLTGIRSRTSKTTANEAGGVPGGATRILQGKLADQFLATQAVLAPFVLSLDDRRQHRGLAPETEEAFTRMWSLQIREGPDKGTWDWTSVDLDPWEAPSSRFYGAALAAIAVGSAPPEYRRRPDVRTNVDDLEAYMRTAQKTQPLHNRLLAVWAASALPHWLPDADRTEIINAAFASQAEDGGWSQSALGPWKDRPKAPPSQGSNSYATAVAAFTLQQAGVKRTDPRMARALDWLKAHQDSQDGSWPASSMNKEFKPGSMQSHFMQDAATAFAVLALLPKAN